MTQQDDQARVEGGDGLNDRARKAMLWLDRTGLTVSNLNKPRNDNEYGRAAQVIDDLLSQLDAAKEQMKWLGGNLEVISTECAAFEAENEQLKATLHSLGVTTYGELNRPVSGDET